MPREIKLSAKKYDEIVALADSLGGVGLGATHDTRGKPLCVIGMLIEVGLLPPASNDVLKLARERFGLNWMDADNAISTEMGWDRNRFLRTPILPVFKRLNITRSDDTPPSEPCQT